MVLFFLMLEIFWNRQLKKIAWKENRWRPRPSSPKRWNWSCCWGTGGAPEWKPVEPPRLEEPLEGKSHTIWAQVSTVSGERNAPHAQPMTRIQPTFVAYANEPLLLHSLSAREGIPLGVAFVRLFMVQQGQCPPMPWYFLSPRDLFNEKDPIFSGSGHLWTPLRGQWGFKTSWPPVPVLGLNWIEPFLDFFWDQELLKTHPHDIKKSPHIPEGN